MSPLPSETTTGILRNYYFFWATKRLIQDRDQSIKNQFFATYVPMKLITGFSKIWHLHAPTKTIMHNVIKPAMVYLPTKLAMQKIVVALSPGNALNMALVLPKLSSYLLQFMTF